MELTYPRCAAIDVAKKEIAVCVRFPGQEPGGRGQEIRKYSTFYGVLKEMCAWLRETGVTIVAMESTGIYSNPVFHALVEFGDFEVLKCNAAHVKNVPGRKTDAADAQWLCELLECGLLKGSYLPTPETARARDYTRYRARLVSSRTSETQRLHKTLEDAGIKLDSVASDVLGVSGRAMVQGLIDGERRGAVLSELARGVLRKKIPDLSMALSGRFSEHHAGLCRLHLKHIDQLNELITETEAQIEALMLPFQHSRELLMTIPGIGSHAAAVILSEIGQDMSFFPTADHLASWAGLAPANNESGGHRRPAGTRKGNQHLRNLLVESAWTVARTKTRPGARFHRLVRRFGGARNPRAKKKAAIAVAHTLLLIIYYVLDRQVPYTDLGPDFYTRHEDPEHYKDKLVARLKKLGYDATLTPATT
ncbi:IS110 family transposase [Streptacidiphilus sp. EB103A]|uniref:IS110 family transposase n=1 Tax=Streptacidiphilus sp. EB103A TaxID=3156275 RepID=UPI003518F1A1